MIHVALYSDENYLDDGYVFMGGYIASVEEWLRMVIPWKAILDEHPTVPYFSNHGFKSQRWIDENGVIDAHLLPAKTLKLAKLIASSNIYFAAHSRLWKSHFEQAVNSRVLASKNPRYELLRDPYYFAYVRLVALLLDHLPRINDVLPPNEALKPIDVFVDENGKLGCNASYLFMNMKRDADPERKNYMGTAAPLDDKVTIPLQCADLYLGQLREWYATGTVTDALAILKSKPFRPPFSDVTLDWTLPKLQEFAESMNGLPENHWIK